MSPFSRKWLLAVHIMFSVGWIGAVFSFLVLSISAGRSADTDAIKSSFISMNTVGLYAVLPFSIGTLVTGLIQALATPWGLFRHYWVLIKFVLTMFATLALLLHQFTAVSKAAELAMSGDLQNPKLASLQIQLLADSAVALVVLLTALGLSIFKPWGLTKFGKTKGNQTKSATPTGLKIFLAVIGLLISVFIFTHLAGKGLHAH